MRPFELEVHRLGQPGLQELSAEVIGALVETLKRWRRLTAYLKEMAEGDEYAEAMLSVEGYVFFRALRDDYGFSSDELITFAKALMAGFEGNDERRTESSPPDNSSDDLPF